MAYHKLCFILSSTHNLEVLFESIRPGFNFLILFNLDSIIRLQQTEIRPSKVSPVAHERIIFALGN